VIDTGDHVALDTMCFIYLFEAHPAFLPRLRPVFTCIERGNISGSASVLALTETLVGALRHGDTPLAARYRRAFLDFPNLKLTPITAKVAAGAAEIRAQHRLRTPDALHLACAVASGADVFLTGDARILSLSDPPLPLMSVGSLAG